MRFTGFKKPQEEEKIRELLSNWKLVSEGGFGVWAAEDLQSNELIGWFMLKETGLDAPELGFMLSKNHWNKGLATEISQGFLHYALVKLSLPLNAAAKN